MDEKRKPVVLLRLTDLEREGVERAAKGERMRLAEWVRKVVMEKVWRGR